MSRLLEIIDDKKVLVSDGAWGTELMKKGFRTGQCPEIWNIERTDEVFSIARDYIVAGADIISTNSFGASKIKLESFNLSDLTYLINKKAAEISKSAASNKLVMGSIGPCGKFLLMDEISENQLRESFQLQIQGLIDGGVDAILFETFYDLNEILIGIQTANEICNLPVIASTTFSKNSDGKFFTIMGNSIYQVYSSLIQNEVDLIGVNCGNGYFESIEIVKEIRSLFQNSYLLVQPNAGLPKIKSGQLFYSETPEDIVPAIETFLELAVTIIGGCCGTTNEHIKAIRKLVDNRIS
jgi:5-methyltetrahydrofolate--homocysteine methyltransferase